MKNMIICKECGLEKPHNAFGLCITCYHKQRPKIICKECGRLMPHAAFELCQTCYSKQNLITCKSCGKLKKHHTKGLCQTCYRHEKGFNKSMSENKSCALYLGVVIAEKVLSKVFKDVKQMPPNNKGYDFKCKKGMCVDVKSSVLHKDKKYINYQGHWLFRVRKNKIADYFLCIAFDNRKDLNPLHIWLIPGKEINNKTGIGISKSKLHKWSQYEQPIDKTLICCDKMRKNKE